MLELELELVTLGGNLTSARCPIQKSCDIDNEGGVSVPVPVPPAVDMPSPSTFISNGLTHTSVDDLQLLGLTFVSFASYCRVLTVQVKGDVRSHVDVDDESKTLD